jgi:hypothetical protein
MDKRDMLLVLTICELLKHSATVQDVQDAYRRAQELLEQSRQTPPQAEIYRARPQR